MTASDDDHEDDAQLQQLRSVWVSMRDEDPPDRGLAALMAAAREKAAELEQAAQPSWWQRFVAAMRRPPVLALATVTVLLGGALVVTQRQADMKAETTASVEAESFDDGLRSKGAPGQAVVAPVTAAGSASVAEPQLAEPTMPANAIAERSKPATKGRPTGTTTTATKPSPKQARPAEPTSSDSYEPETVVAGPRGGTGATTGGAPLQIAKDEAAPEAPTRPTDTAAAVDVDVKAKKPIMRTPPPSIQGEDREDTPTVAQLVKQCESAAARGDCAAVRLLAKKIQSSSPATYKSRITSNAAINRCLP